MMKRSILVVLLLGMIGSCTGGSDVEHSTAPTLTTPAPVANATKPAPFTPGYIFKDCSDCPEMVVVPAGSFTMGDLDGTGASDQRPVHEVTIPHPIAVGRYEVTQDEWVDLMKSNPSRWTGRSNPVEQVSWQEAKEFANRLSAKTGKGYRLLTEAEWEYVARGGSSTTFPWGDFIDFTKANYGRYVTRAVGSYPPNGFGLYDITGNAWEWVEDCYHATYEGVPTDGTARMEADCAAHVFRGGSFGVQPQFVLAGTALRGSYVAGHTFVGLRLARFLGPSEPGVR